jgi:phthiodiolone/phenolphthiodiolone dimycocerosates ketoreductase
MSDLSRQVTRRLRLGVSGMSRLPVERLVADTIRAEADGATCVLWPDHLMAWHSQVLWSERLTPLARRQSSPHEYLNVVACAAVAGHCSTRVRVGSGVTDVQRTHPAVLAQQYLTIHHLSSGRCILGLGAGEGENTAPYGIRSPRPITMLEEGIEIIRLLWESEDPVDFAGTCWPLRGAVLGLGPVTGAGYPAIWVAGSGPRTLDLVGRLADGWIPMLMAPSEYKAKLTEIARIRERVGRAEPFEPALYTYVCYGKSKDDCLQLFDSPMYKSLALLLPAREFESMGVQHPLGERGGLHGFVPTWFEEDELLGILDRVPQELVARIILHGSPDDILQELETLSGIGVQTVILANVSFLTDAGRVRPSFEAQRDLLRRFSVTVAEDSQSAEEST